MIVRSLHFKFEIEFSFSGAYNESVLCSEYGFVELYKFNVSSRVWTNITERDQLLGCFMEWLLGTTKHTFSVVRLEGKVSFWSLQLDFKS